METQNLKICILTQSPEKFLCLNQDCCRSEKKQLQCYECLNKQHIGKNKTIRHLDDFIELDKFMKLIKDKCESKEVFLNQLLLSCNDYQKEKIQQIELTQTTDVAKLAREKIETDFSEFLLKIGQEQMKLKSFFIYSQSNHSQMMQLYFENNSEYFENFKKQFKQLAENTQTFVMAFDCNTKNQLKKLDEIIKTLQLAASKNKIQNQISNPILLLFLIPLIISYFLLQYQFEAKISSIQQESKIYWEQMQQTITHKEESLTKQSIQEDISSLNATVNLLKSEVYELLLTLNITNENLEKLKLRFDTFKRSSQGQNQELKTQILNLIDKLKTEQQSQIQISFQEQISELKSKVTNITENYENQLSQFTSLINKVNQTLYNQFISQFSQFMLQDQNLNNKTSTAYEDIKSTTDHKTKKQKIIEENQDLLGQIHLNLSLNRLSNFTLVYDHYLNKYISLSKMDKLLRMATQNSEDALICLGGLSKANLNEFIVAACDFASEVFQPTESPIQARKSLNGDIYWYLLDYRSFGFSPKENIKLVLCDDEDPEDERRFSYWFSTQGRVGGRRIGKEAHLDNSLQHKLQIYMLRQ